MDLTDGDAFALVLAHLVAESVADLDRPHVLMITEEGTVHVSGPYENAQATLCALEDDRAANPEVPAGGRSYGVAPLLPAYCPHLVSPRQEVD
ncbi:hypothetical protein [Pimelobacter simplex]|uniref:hypothetical protein n=1 Tax=Nocardioides simplex TaxID=2045 RepID=UPI003AAF0DE9